MAGVLTPGSGNDFRYKGTTDGGAPSTGSFTAGDWVEDASTIWICTAAGTPGTWESPASGPLANVTTLGFVAPNADVVSVQSLNGLAGPALQIISQTVAKAVGLLLVPEATADEAGSTSQLILYGKTGNNYNRFSLSNNNHAVIIDSTYNGTGAARPVALQMGGSVSNSITSQNAWRANADASLDLNGSAAFTAGGASNWSPTATRVADFADTGTSRLHIDTRVTTPADNVADASFIEFRRGGNRKWQVGLNANGGNADSYDWNIPAGANYLSLGKLGTLTVSCNSIDNSAQLFLVNTKASGHTWRVGEFNQLGMLSFRDVTASGAPLVLNLDGTNKLLDLSVTDGINIKTGSTTGTKLGTATTQKLGFWNATPIVQPARAGALTDNSGGTSGGATIAAIGGAVDPTAALKTDTANAVATLAAKVNAIEAKLSAAAGGSGITA